MSHKHREYIWLQSAQSLNLGKSGLWFGYCCTSHGHSLVFLSLCPGIPCPNDAKPISKACTSPFPRSTFPNLDHISSVTIPDYINGQQKTYERRKPKRVHSWGRTKKGGRPRSTFSLVATLVPLLMVFFPCIVLFIFLVNSDLPFKASSNAYHWFLKQFIHVPITTVMICHYGYLLIYFSFEVLNVDNIFYSFRNPYCLPQCIY